MPDYSQYLHAPQIRHDEEIQRRYGGCIPPKERSENRAGKGADGKGQEIPETGTGYEPAVGGEILIEKESRLLLQEPGFFIAMIYRLRFCAGMLHNRLP